MAVTVDRVLVADPIEVRNFTGVACCCRKSAKLVSSGCLQQIQFRDVHCERILFFLLLWCPRPQGLLELSSICVRTVSSINNVKVNISMVACNLKSGRKRHSRKLLQNQLFFTDGRLPQLLVLDHKLGVAEVVFF